MDFDNIFNLPEKYWKLEKDGITKTLKTDKELLDEGLINQDEYNQRTNKKREKEYEIKTDKQVLELTRAFLNRNIDNLTEEEKLILDSINTEVEEIKTQYPKQN